MSLSGAEIVGSSNSSPLNLAGWRLTGLALTDHQVGSNGAVGSEGDDSVRGTSGNDPIDGRAGGDSMLFAGTRPSYLFSHFSRNMQFKDLGTDGNGVGGKEYLESFEFFHFIFSKCFQVTPVNDPPVAGPVTLAAIAEDSGARLITAGELLAGVSDADSATLTITALTIAAGAGTLVDNGNATWSYTPALDDDTAVTFAYTVSDGARTASSTAALDITPVADAPGNTAPEAVADSATVAEGGTVTVLASAAASVLANDTDGESNALAAILVAGPAHGALVLNGDGSFSYTHDGSETASDSFTYKANDGTADSNTVTVAITVTPVNDPPVAVPVTLAAIAEDSGARLITAGELLAGVSDADSATLTITALTIAAGAGTLVDNGNATWSYTPALDDDTAVTFAYTVSDGARTASSTAALDITPVADAPGNTAPEAVADSATVAEGGTVTVLASAAASVLANDTDGESNALAAILVAGPAHGALVLNGDGSFSYTHDGSETASDSFTYKANDGTADSNTVTVAITVTPVNDPPVAGPVTLAAIAEDSGARLITAGELLAGVSDADSATLTITALTIAAGAGTLVDNGNATWSYTPALDDDTAVTFAYTVSDGARTASSTAALDITPVADAPGNTAPEAVADSATVAEGGTVTVLASAAASVLANDTDGESNALAAILVAGPAHGALVLNGDGSFSYTHDGSETASDSFTYKANDGTADSNTVTVAITVTPVNDPPVAGPVTLAAITEDSGARLITAGELLAGVSDVDSATLTITALTIAAGAGTLVDNGNASWSYTPALDDDTAVTFAYTVSDGALTASSTAALDITPVADAPGNTAPEAVADSATVAEGGTVTVLASAAASVLANDTDGESNALAAILVAGPAHGALVLNADGSFSYTHDGSETASDSFTYKANDGTADSNTVTVAITVTPVNDPPVAGPVTLAAIAEDSGARLITAGELLAGVSDADSATLTITALTIAAGAGTLVDNGNASWSYTPALDDDTAVTFAYTVSDGARTASSTAALDITPVADAPGNTAPEAVADSATVAEGGTVTVLASAAASVLANDTDGESNALAAILVAGPAHGALVLNGDGSFSYTHDGSETASDSFTYKANDGTADSNTVTVAITVTPVNDPPVAVPVTLAAIAEDSGARLITAGELLAGVSDADSATLTITALTIAAGAGTLVDNGNATWSYTPALDDDTAVTFAYTVSDGARTASSTAALDITPVADAPGNTAPEAVADSATVAEGGARIVIDVLANDTDADVGDTKKVLSINDELLQGTVVDVAADGSAVFYSIGQAFQFLGAGETEIETFSYTMVDGQGASSTAGVTVTVTGVNDAPVAADDFKSTGITEDSEPVLLDVLLNDTDIDGNDTKTVVSVDTTGLLGSVEIVEDGSAVIYTIARAFQALNQGEFATDTFIYTLEDSAGEQRTAKVTLTILGADEPPPLGSIIGTGFDDVIDSTSTPPATEGVDTIFGLSGDDQVSSAGGADRLFGGPGRDTLDGGAGNDELVGNTDRDDLIGGTGADNFVFERLLDSAAADPDTILDFNSSEGDVIDLHLIDADAGAAGDNAFTLSAEFTRVAGQLIFDQITNQVQGDVNGDALADFAIIVQLVGGTSLGSADFIL